MKVSPLVLRLSLYLSYGWSSTNTIAYILVVMSLNIVSAGALRPL